MDSDWLLIILAIVLVVAVVVGGAIWMINMAEAEEVLADKECQELGFEKYYEFGFRKYCVKDGRKTKIEGSCSSRRCVFVFR